jgi:hypothetical protein
MSNSDHVILFIFLFSFFIFWGSNFKSTERNNNNRIYSLIPIIFYSIITGSRYGWGVDYLSYKYRLENAFKFPEEQIGFRFINQTIKILDFNYVGGFIIYSFIFMSSAFLLIYSYKRISLYMFYFLIPTTLIFVTSIIRQGLAMSFVLLGLYFFNKKKWPFCIFALLIGISIHTTTIITIAILAGMYFVSQKPFSWKITIPIYLFLTFFFNPSSIGFISGFIYQYISLDNSFQSYIDNSDIWFSSEAANKIYDQSLFAQIVSSLFYISIFYLGYVTLKFKPNSKILFLYNTVILGILFYRVVFTFEILRRIAEPLIMLNFIILGYIFFVINGLKINKNYTGNLNIQIIKDRLFPHHKYFTAFIYIYFVLFFGRFVFLNPTAIFFWDK